MYVLTKILKCLCTFHLKNSNLQIFIHKKLCIKLQLYDEKTCVDPWSHIDTFEGWSVLTETIVIGYKQVLDSTDPTPCDIYVRTLIMYVAQFIVNSSTITLLI